MASSTYQRQQDIQKQNQVSGAAKLSGQMSVLAQAKPAIVSPSATNSFSIPTGALSEKINTALNLSSAGLNQQDRTDISRLFSSYGNEWSNRQQEGLQRSGQHIEDDNVLMRQNASNQMRQAAVMAAVASQQKVRLSATERLALTAKRPPAPTCPAESPAGAVASRSSAKVGDSASSTPLTGSKSSSSLPTLETLLAVQRQLQQHTRQNLNSVPQPQMVISSLSSPREEAPPKQQPNTKAAAHPQLNSTQSQQTSDPHPHPHPNQAHSAQSNKPLPPPPPKSPTRQCPSSVSYEKELPPLPQSVSPSTTCTTTSDESQMNSLESHQSSPSTSLVSIPPPPPPISSYLEQYDEVNSVCRQSNSSTPSTIATSDIASVKQFSFAQNRPLESTYPTSNENFYYYHQNNFNHQQQQQQQHCKPKPPTLAPRPTKLDYQRVLKNQTNHFNERKQQSSPEVNGWAGLDHNRSMRQLDQVESARRDSNQMQNSYSQSAKQTAVDSDSNESSSASNVSYDISYRPQLNYQQHVFTRTSASLPTMIAPLPAPLPPPPPPSNFIGHEQVPTQIDPSSCGLDELDSAFRFPTPPPLDMLLAEPEGHLDDYDDDDEVQKAPIQGDQYIEDEDFECRIPTPPHHESMSAVSFQKLHSGRAQMQLPANHQARVCRQQSLSPPSFDSSSAANNISSPQPPASFRQTSSNLEAAAKVVAETSPSPSVANNGPVCTPQLIVHINTNTSNNNESGLLSTTSNANSHLQHHLNHHHHHHQSSVNHHYSHHHHHHMMLTGMAASSSSPSSSSDGDGRSSNSSSSTSGIHSSIDSPSSSNSKLDDFNYSANKLKENASKIRQPLCLQTGKLANNNLKNNISVNKLPGGPTTTTSTTMSKHHHSTGVTGGGVPPKASSAAPTLAPSIIKPALKQKKSVSFSDKVELVACAEEQSEDHLPNPLLARVLAGKLQ